jgi:nicotinamide mononucleotide transporter
VFPLGALGSYPTNRLELFAVLFNLVCVCLTVRQKIICWPIGIVGALASGWLFLEISLLADAYLQVFFIGTSVYGWYWWQRGGPNHNRLPVSELSAKQRALWALATLAAIVTVGTLHARYTKADLPYLDALASGGSVTAQLLMMRKKIDCWPLWVAVNVLSIYIYAYKQVYFYTALYVLFLALAFVGWHQWTQDSRTQSSNSSAA